MSLPSPAVGSRSNLYRKSRRLRGLATRAGPGPATLTLSLGPVERLLDVLEAQPAQREHDGRSTRLVRARVRVRVRGRVKVRVRVRVRAPP